MATRIDSPKGLAEARAEYQADFTERIPVGTLVENFHLDAIMGGEHFGITAEGGIYDNPNLADVNIINYNGGEATALWQAAYLEVKY